MFDQTDPRLEQAKHLIEARQRSEARALLISFLKYDARNAEALYLYSQVARSPQESIKALRRVLDLDPFNYHARARLNKLEKRSVEQLSHGTDRLSQKRQFRFSMYTAVVALLLVVIIAGGAALVFSTQSTFDSSENVIAVSSTENATPTMSDTSVPSHTPLGNIEVARPGATWTPQPTNTPAPSRTTAPTLTVRPSNTPIPTYTPTVPEVAMIVPGLPEFSRVYTEYLELSASVSWSKDPETLGNIERALEVIIASIELYNYDNDVNAEKWTTFMEDFLALLESEKSLAAHRRDLIELQQETEGTDDPELQNTPGPGISGINREITDILDVRLIQQETVHRELQALINNATATVEWSNKIDSLKTPSSTPIVVPTATLNS